MVAWASFLAAYVCQLRRETRLTREYAERSTMLGAEQGFTQDLALGIALRGWAAVNENRIEEGIAQIREGMTLWRAKGGKLNWTWFCVLLAEACRQAGRIDEGLSAIAEALDVSQETGERVFAAEVYRLKGTLVLQSTVHSPQKIV